VAGSISEQVLPLMEIAQVATSSGHVGLEVSPRLHVLVVPVVRVLITARAEPRHEAREDLTTVVIREPTCRAVGYNYMVCDAGRKDAVAVRSLRKKRRRS
jgi:hypothetical protein